VVPEIIVMGTWALTSRKSAGLGQYRVNVIRGYLCKKMFKLHFFFKFSQAFFSKSHFSEIKPLCTKIKYFSHHYDHTMMTSSSVVSAPI